MNADVLTGRVARKRAALRQAILSCALDYFSAGDRPTMSALADETDCAIGTLYSHFQSLDDVIHGLETAYFARVGSALPAVLDQTAPLTDRLADAALAVFHFACRDRRFCASYFELGRDAAITDAAFGGVFTAMLAADGAALPFAARSYAVSLTTGAVQTGLFSIYHEIATPASLSEIVRCLLIALGEEPAAAKQASCRTPLKLMPEFEF